MAFNLYINAAARDPKSALCISPTNLSPISPPAWVLSDNPDLNVYIVDGAGGYSTLSTTGTFSLGIGTIQASPSGGTFTLTSGANTTSALAYNLSASTLSTALNALASITAEGGVTVTGTAPLFTIDWVTVGNKGALSGTATNLTPDSAVVCSTTRAGTGSVYERQIVRLTRQPAALQSTWSAITNGRNATLSLNTQGMVDLVASNTTVETVLEAQHTDASSNVRTLLQVPILIRGEVIDEQSLVPTPVTSYLTSSQTYDAFVQNRYAVTGLTGGGSSKLDGIVTAGSAATVGWQVTVALSGVLSVYVLESSTQAESSPNWIRPDDYSAGTNERVWRLLTVTGSVAAHVSTHAPGGADPIPWTTAHGKGTTGARPAAAAGNAGYLYYNETTSTMQRSTGAAWVDVGETANASLAVNQAGHGFVVQRAVRLSGSTWIKAQADSEANAEAVGIVTAVADADNFTVTFGGYSAAFSGLTAGSVYFLSASSSGVLTTTEPTTAGEVSKPMLVAISATAGVIANMRGVLLTAGPSISVQVACSDTTSTITTGNAKVTFPIPANFTLTEVFCSVSTVSSSGVVTVDVNQNGSTIFTTKCTIDASEYTSLTAATPPVLLLTTMVKGDIMTVDIDTAGTGAVGLVLTMNGTRT